MRLVLATVVAALACAVLVGSGAAAPPSPFAGSWVATDVDGSNMRMQVLGSGARGVHWIVWYDDDATTCHHVPALIFARATVMAGPPTTMVATVRIFCLDGSAPLQNNVPIVWAASGDVLTMIPDSVEWTRP